MSRRSPGSGSSRLGLHLSGRIARRTTGVAQSISRRSRSLSQGRTGTGPLPQPTMADLRSHADAALVAADDALLASAEELAALADPGLPMGLRCSEEVISPFREAQRSALADFDAACALRARAAAEPDATLESDVLTAAQTLCRSAGARLDEQSRAFDAMRNLDRVMASLLPALNGRVQVLRERIVDVTRGRAERGAQDPPLALSAARSEIDDAGERVDFAADCLKVAGQLLRAGDRRGAIARGRAAEAAIRQATVLLDMLAAVPVERSRAVTGVKTLMHQLGADLAAARTVTSLAPTVPAMAFATATLEWAGSARDAARDDSLAARRALMDSDAALVLALGDSFDPSAAQERAATLADCFSDAAACSMRAASNALNTRRALVGAEARLRLAAARRELRETTADDPVRRLPHLQAGDRLADESLALVYRDAARAHDQMMASGGFGELTAAVVGGILVRQPGADVTTAPASAHERTSPPGARLGPIGAVSFGGPATRFRRGGAGRF